MPTQQKSTKEGHEKPEVLDTFIPLFTKNVERIAELEKKSLEIAAEQNAEWLDGFKKAFRSTPEMPGLLWFDLMGQTFDRLIETEKGVIDLMVEQSHSMANLAHERGGSATKTVEGVTALLQQTVEHTVAAQKKALDYVAEQQKATYDTVKKQFRISSTPAAEAFQSGFDTLIETQKAMLDIASRPLKRAAAA